MKAWLQPGETPAQASRRELVASIVVVGTCLSSYLHYLVAVRLGEASGLRSFLFDPRDQFMDFFNVLEMARGLDPYHSHLWAVYFPVTFVILFPFTRLTPWLALGSVFALFVLTWIMTAALGMLAAERPRRWTAFVGLSLCSYPFLFALDRGNVEVVVFCLLAGMFAGLSTGRLGLAACCLGTCIAMKGFPGIFLVMFASRTRWKAGLSAIVLAIALTVGSLAVFGGSIREQCTALARILKRYDEQYVVQDAGLNYGHSIFGAMKMVGKAVAERALVKGPGASFGATKIVREPAPGRAQAQKARLRGALVMVRKWYGVFALGIGVVVLGWVASRESKDWRSVTLLVATMNLLPFVSADYKMIHLLFPLVLFLRERELQRSDSLVAILFGMLLIPNRFLLGEVVTPLLLLILACLVVADMRRPSNLEGLWGAHERREH